MVKIGDVEFVDVTPDLCVAISAESTAGPVTDLSGLKL